MAEAAVTLSRNFAISRRQAYRYLQEAQEIGHLVAIAEPSQALTLKIPDNVARELRAYAARSELTLSGSRRVPSRDFWRPYAGMADSRRRESYDVCLQHVFDRLLGAKLQQAYEILVPDRVRITGDRIRVTGGGDEDGRDLRQGVVGQAEGGEHHCQSDGGVGRFRAQPRLRCAGRMDLRG
jgi:hypothetical protein